MGRIQELVAPPARQATTVQTLKRESFPNVRADWRPATVVALALLPGSVAFSVIAGVGPQVGFSASFIIAVLTGIFGGLVSTLPAAAMAVPFVSSEKNRAEYLFVATSLAAF